MRFGAGAVEAPPLTCASVVLVDDHGIVRDGIAALLRPEAGLRIVGTAASGADAVRVAQVLRPDVIIMDLMLPDMNGLETTRRILAQFPKIRVIVLSACHRAEHVHRALRAGARGYVVKEAAGTTLGLAVRAVCAGQFYVSPGVGGCPSGELNIADLPRTSYEQLSARELEVLRYIVLGSSSRAVAHRLSLSAKTIDSYRSRIMSKLCVRNRSELIKLVIESELLAV